MPNTLWDSCIEQLSSFLSPEDIEGWILPVSPEVDDTEKTITLYAPNKYVRDRIEKQFLQTIELAIKRFEPDFSVILKQGQPLSLFDEQAQPAQKKTKYAGKINSMHTFQSFVEGSSNHIALSAALNVSQNPDGTYNPLMIYGSTGLGKSHLLHAIGNAIKSQFPRKKVVFQSAEHFMIEMITSFGEGRESTTAFKEFYRNVDVLLIDDVQFFAGKGKTQEEFFHLFNTLKESNSQVVLTCDRYPKDVEGLEARLKSRFGGGLSVAVEPPDLETRAAILKKKANAVGMALDDSVILFVASKVRSHVRDLEGALNQLYASAQFTEQEIITVDFAREALASLIGSQNRQVEVGNIQKTVATYYQINLADLKSKRRKSAIARPRQVAMALTKQLTNLSLPEIGAAFERDHTTVMYAIKKIEELRKTEPRIREDFANLLTTLTH